MYFASRWLPVVLFGSLALVGCESSDDGGDTQADGDTHSDGDTHADGDTHSDGDTHGDETGETDGEASCASETRDDEFAIGLSKSGEYVRATFVSADPAPPIKGDNTWVLEFTDLAGEPLTDLGIVAIPMMPDHGHGTPVNTEIMAAAEPGQYTLLPVNLFMTGYWEITLELSLGDGTQDSLMFGFCVD